MADEQQPRQCVIPIHKPSERELTFFFITGIVVSVPMAVFFENLIPLVPAIISVAVLAPFIEELAKVFPLFYRHGETERSIVTLGVLMGLGFGVSELVEYVVLLHVPLIIRIPAVVFHASSAAITAFGIAKKNPLPYYLISVTLHGLNNFFAVTGLSLGVFGELLVLISAYYLAYHFYRQASSEKIVV
ncbi:MAG TPA: PrsW family glutamic-type intramembrane protease [Candidatus Limnocylindrales bacterium]|nr:PrsW family glutamic-type intramembrane protease [Candidatus Limnocylindrales bacterium]